MNHLAIVRAAVAYKIASKTKTVESRLSVNRPPAWNCEQGDFVYFKISGGDVVLRTCVAGVDKFAALCPDDIPAIAELFSAPMGITTENQYWEQKRGARYAVLIHLSDVTAVHFSKAELPRSFGTAWITNWELGNNSLGAAITYQPMLHQTPPI